MSSHWTWNFFVVMITPVLINRLGWKTYLIFMALSVSSSGESIRFAPLPGVRDPFLIQD